MDDDPFGLGQHFRLSQRRRVSEPDDGLVGLGDHLHNPGCVFSQMRFWLQCWAVRFHDLA